MVALEDVFELSDQELKKEYWRVQKLIEDGGAHDELMELIKQEIEERMDSNLVFEMIQKEPVMEQEVKQATLNQSLDQDRGEGLDQDRGEGLDQDRGEGLDQGLKLEKEGKGNTSPLSKMDRMETVGSCEQGKEVRRENGSLKLATPHRDSISASLTDFQTPSMYYVNKEDVSTSQKKDENRRKSLKRLETNSVKKISPLKKSMLHLQKDLPTTKTTIRYKRQAKSKVDCKLTRASFLDRNFLKKTDGDYVIIMNSQNTKKGNLNKKPAKRKIELKEKKKVYPNYLQELRKEKGKFNNQENITKNKIRKNSKPKFTKRASTKNISTIKVPKPSNTSSKSTNNLSDLVSTENMKPNRTETECTNDLVKTSQEMYKTENETLDTEKANDSIKHIDSSDVLDNVDSSDDVSTSEVEDISDLTDNNINEMIQELSVQCSEESPTTDVVDKSEEKEVHDDEVIEDFNDVVNELLVLHLPTNSKTVPELVPSESLKEVNSSNRLMVPETQEQSLKNESNPKEVVETTVLSKNCEDETNSDLLSEGFSSEDSASMIDSQEKEIWSDEQEMDFDNLETAQDKDSDTSSLSSSTSKSSLGNKSSKNTRKPPTTQISKYLSLRERFVRPNFSFDRVRCQILDQLASHPSEHFEIADQLSDIDPTVILNFLQYCSEDRNKAKEQLYKRVTSWKRIVNTNFDYTQIWPTFFDIFTVCQSTKIAKSNVLAMMREYIQPLKEIKHRLQAWQKQELENDENYLYISIQENRPEVYKIVSEAIQTGASSWKLNPEGNESTENMIWWWSKPKVNRKLLLQWQSVNHFSNSTCLTRKDLLKRSLDRFTLIPGKKREEFSIMPETFILSSDYMKCLEMYQDNDGRPWITKPIGMSRGRGIKIITDFHQLRYCQDHVVVQKYIENPLLIKGRKFDLRLYVLVTSWKPLEAFVYREGFARFASEKFTLSPESFENSFIHLTNTSIQQFSKQGTQKITLNSLKDELNDIDVDFTELWPKITYLITKSLFCVQSQIQSSKVNNTNSFELFGYDVLIDDELTPWLLEVNASPSMECSIPIDNIKLEMIRDTINLVNPLYYDRNILLQVIERRLSWYENKRRNTREFNDQAQWNDELRAILHGQIPRRIGELPTHMGNYERIAPSPMYKRLKKRFSSKLPTVAMK